MLTKNLSLLVILLSFVGTPAFAAVEFCNRLPSDLEVSFGYQKAKDEWAAKGWYEIPPGQCQIVHGQDDPGKEGEPVTYYYFANAFVGNNQLTWGGDSKDSTLPTFCLSNEPFDEVAGSAPCTQRGLIERKFQPIKIPARPGYKHVIEFSNASANLSVTPVSQKR